MFKKILVTAILLSLLIAGNLFAEGESVYTWQVVIDIHGFCEQLIVGYWAQDGWHMEWNIEDLPTGIYDQYDVQVTTGEYPPNIITVEGWGPYGAHDYDECVAQLYGTNELELWLGVEPPGEEDPPE